MRSARTSANAVSKNKVGYTVENWNSHKSSGGHTQQVALKEERQRLEARIKAKDPTLTKSDRKAAKVMGRNQVRRFLAYH